MSESSGQTEPEQTPGVPPHGPAGRQREPMFNVPAVVLAIIGLCVGVYLMQVYVLNGSQNLVLLYNAAFIPVLYTGQYGFDWFMLHGPFTYAFLHGGFARISPSTWSGSPPLARRWPIVSAGAVRFLLRDDGIGRRRAVLGHPSLHGGAAGRRVRRDFRHDGGCGALWLPHRPLVRQGGFRRRARCRSRLVVRSRGVMAFLAVWMIINLATGLVGLGPSGSATRSPGRPILAALSPASSVCAFSIDVRRGVIEGACRRRT